MKLYNTLTKKVEEFKPIDNQTVRLYSCGPTVYDHAHIGNLSAFIAADTLKRTLRMQGYSVQHVMNFTDVDDKTIRKSQELYPNIESKDALKKLTRKYEEVFLSDMQTIGNSVDDITFVRATDSIPEMQVLISVLYDEGFAYIADDGVYFSIENYTKAGKTYGQLSRIDSSSTSRERISNDEYDKDSVHDFALWKFKKDDQPSWDFHLDDQHFPGRPGWHIECSAMSTMKLGQPFDIHTGGIDLIFPHHENEIAQSTAAKDTDIYAKFFVHSEHLLVDGKKMSKSAGNFYTLEDVKKKGFDPLAFRLLVLQSHYRNQSNFTWGNLQAAQNRLNELRTWADLRYQPSTDKMLTSLDKQLRSTRQDVINSLNSDLNTPVALASLSSLTNFMANIAIPSTTGKYTNETLLLFDEVFGLGLGNRPDISEPQKKLVKEREEARSDKNWQKSDQLRDVLLQDGIELRDTPNGQVWSRK